MTTNRAEVKNLNPNAGGALIVKGSNTDAQKIGPGQSTTVSWETGEISITPDTGPGSISEHGSGTRKTA